jgi:hypothetical protein
MKMVQTWMGDLIYNRAVRARIYTICEGAEGRCCCARGAIGIKVQWEAKGCCAREKH